MFCFPCSSLSMALLLFCTETASPIFSLLLQYTKMRERIYSFLQWSLQATREKGNPYPPKYLSFLLGYFKQNLTIIKTLVDLIKIRKISAIFPIFLIISPMSWVIDPLRDYLFLRMKRQNRKTKVCTIRR